MPPNNAFFMAQAQAAAAAAARGAARGASGGRGGPVPGMANVAPPNMAMPMGGRPPVPPTQRPAPPTGGPRGNARPHLPSGPLPGQDGATVPPTLTSQALLAASPTQQKQMLGEALYPKIHEMNPSLAGKITGMLLEMSNDELLALIDNQEALRLKVEEALTVYDDYVKTKDGEPDAETGKPDPVKENGEQKEEK